MSKLYCFDRYDTIVPYPSSFPGGPMTDADSLPPLTARERRKLSKILSTTTTQITRASNEQLAEIGETLSEGRLAVLTAAVAVFAALPPGEQLERIREEKLKRVEAAGAAKKGGGNAQS